MAEPINNGRLFPSSAAITKSPPPMVTPVRPDCRPRNVLSSYTGPQPALDLSSQRLGFYRANVGTGSDGRFLMPAPMPGMSSANGRLRWHQPKLDADTGSRRQSERDGAIHRLQFRQQHVGHRQRASWFAAANRRAAAPAYAQANWNNLSQKGSGVT